MNAIFRTIPWMATVAAACSLAIPSGAIAQDDSTQRFGPGPLAEGTPQQQPGRAESIPAKDLLPPKPFQAAFKILEGEKMGEEIEVSFQQVPQTESDWYLEFGNYNRTFLQWDDQEGWLCYRIDLIDRGQALLYSEPVRFLPAVIRPNRTYEQDITVSVYDLESGEKTREGTGTHRVEAAAKEVVNLPADRIQGFQIELQQELNFSAATVELNLTNTYARDTGVIKRRLQYTVEKMFFFGETEERISALAE